MGSSPIAFLIGHGLPTLLSSLLSTGVSLFSICIFSSHVPSPLPAFGFASAVFLISSGFINGLTDGCIKFYASHKSEGDIFSLRHCAITSLFLAAPVTLALTPTLTLYFSLLPPKISLWEQIFSYLNIIKWCLPFNALTIAFSSYLIYRQKTWFSLKLCLFVSLCNLLNIILTQIYAPHLLHDLNYFGYMSLLWSVIATLTYACSCLSIASVSISRINTSLLETFSLRHIKKIISNSLNSGFQNVILIASFSLLTIMTESMGLKELSVMTLLLTLNRTFILPAKSFGTIAGSLAVNELHEHHTETANGILKAGVRLFCYTITPVALCMIFFPKQLMSTFLPPNIDSASYHHIMRISGASLLVEPFSGFLSNALKAHGATRPLLYASLYQWIITLPLSWYYGVIKSYGLIAVWINILSFRVIFSLMCLYLWARLYSHHRNAPS